ncbi:LOW QUALITY PROTEIN: Myb_DNA-bind_3 domain-containing protein, partial [Cephalotus follicularis]
LKNKWEYLKKDYLLWKELIGKDTGLGWDSIKKTVDVDDSWWKQRIQVTGIESELQDKLGSIFFFIVATEAWAWTPSSGALLGEGVNRIEVNGSGPSADNDEDFDVHLEEINVNPEDIETTHRKRKKSPNSTQLTSKKGRTSGKANKSGSSIYLNRLDRLVDTVESKSTVQCFNMFRMDGSVLKPVSELQLKYGFKTTRRISALEIVCIFVHIVGQGCSIILAQERFHSRETVSRVFTEVLESVCQMEFDVLKLPDPEFKDTPRQILEDSRYMPHFK